MIKDSLNKNVTTLRINNSFLKADLSMWGLVPNKTNNPIIPSISTDLLNYFIIGLIDADGTVKFNKKKTVRLVGNKQIMYWVLESIKKMGFTGHYNHYTEYSDLWSIIDISRKKDVIDLCKILKIDKCNFLLNRKWQDIKNYLTKEVI